MRSCSAILNSPRIAACRNGRGSFQDEPAQKKRQHGWRRQAYAGATHRCGTKHSLRAARGNFHISVVVHEPALVHYQLRHARPARTTFPSRSACVPLFALSLATVIAGHMVTTQ